MPRNSFMPGDMMPFRGPSSVTIAGAASASLPQIVAPINRVSIAHAQTIALKILDTLSMVISPFVRRGADLGSWKRTLSPPWADELCYGSWDGPRKAATALLPATLLIALPAFRYTPAVNARVYFTLQPGCQGFFCRSAVKRADRDAGSLIFPVKRSQPRLTKIFPALPTAPRSGQREGRRQSGELPRKYLKCLWPREIT